MIQRVIRFMGLQLPFLGSLLSEQERAALRHLLPAASIVEAGPLTEVAHRGGAKVLHTIASGDAARRAVDDGADIIVAQGWEAGGHVHGKVATMALVPTVVDRVSGTPVIAAGGIADGRGLAAAMALGASGAWIRTRFPASPDAAIHSRYRNLLLAGGAIVLGTIELGTKTVTLSVNSAARAARGATRRRARRSRLPRPEEGDRVAEDAGEPISAAASRRSDGRLRLHVAVARTRRWRRAAVTGSRRGLRKCGKASAPLI